MFSLHKFAQGTEQKCACIYKFVCQMIYIYLYTLHTSSLSFSLPKIYIYTRERETKWRCLANII